MCEKFIQPYMDIEAPDLSREQTDLGLHRFPIYFPKSKINFLKFCERIHTVLPAKIVSDIMFCLQYYQGLIIDRSLLY